MDTYKAEMLKSSKKEKKTKGEEERERNKIKNHKAIKNIYIKCFSRENAKIWRFSRVTGAYCILQFCLSLCRISGSRIFWKPDNMWPIEALILRKVVQD